MKLKLDVILAIAILAIVMVAPVTAETLTGTLGGSTYPQVTFGGAGVAATTYRDLTLVANDIQSSGTLLGITLFEATKATYGSVDPTGSYFQRVNITYGSQLVATGSMGYNRQYNLAGTEQPGNLNIVFDFWNITGLTGDITLNTSITSGPLYNRTGNGYASGSIPSGGIAFGCTQAVASYEMTTGTTIYNTRAYITNAVYTVTKAEPTAGGGILGSVVKTITASRVFVLNGTSRAVVASELTTGIGTYNFSTIAQSIIIAVTDGSGSWYNSSTLFSAVTPTPTTTPLPSGKIRTYFQNIDGTYGGRLFDSNIGLYDSKTATWSNVTADPSGDHYIDTDSDSTITAVGSMTGYVSDTRTNLTPLDTVYFLSLYPTNMLPAAPAGYVNLIVKVQDDLTLKVIKGATVRTVPPSGAVQYAETNAAGLANFVLPNSSLIVVNAEKSGYVGVTKNKVTSASGTDNILIELEKGVVTTTVTPTGTIAPGSTGTPAPVQTIIPGCEDPDSIACAQAQDQDMMQLIREFAPVLITMSCIMTLLYIMGVKV